MTASKWNFARVRKIILVAGFILLLVLISRASHTPQNELDLPTHRVSSPNLDNAQTLQLVKEYAPQFKNKIISHYNEVQAQRTFWYLLILLGILPLAAFSGFLLFPYLMRKAIAERFPGVPFSRYFRLYFKQAFLAAIVMLGLGAALFGSQYILMKTGRESNPQVVLQEEAIDYIDMNRTQLVNRYPEVMSHFAENLADLPDEALISVLIRSGLEIRENGGLGFEAAVIDFTWPTFSVFFVVSLGLVMFFFFQRVWPDLLSMLETPIKMLEAEQRGALFSPTRSNFQLLRLELRSLIIFVLLATGLARLMGYFLARFFKPVAGQLVELTAGGMNYYARNDGDSTVVALSIFLQLLFLIETVVLFLLAFTFLTGKAGDIIRAYTAKKLQRKNKSYRPLLNSIWRFLWVVGIATGLGIGLTLLSANLVGDFTTGNRPNWVLILLLIPLLLVVGFNLGMWLSQAFKQLYTLFKSPVVPPEATNFTVVLNTPPPVA